MKQLFFFLKGLGWVFCTPTNFMSLLKLFFFSRGSDFRREYKNACMLRGIAAKPVCLLTATCSPRVKTDLLNSFKLSQHELFQVAVLPDRYVSNQI